jgi:hypothetical protein
VLGLEQTPLFAVLSAADLVAAADLAEARSFGALVSRILAEALRATLTAERAPP